MLTENVNNDAKYFQGLNIPMEEIKKTDQKDKVKTEEVDTEETEKKPKLEYLSE